MKNRDTFQVLAAVSLADGRISEAELTVLDGFAKRLGLDASTCGAIVAEVRRGGGRITLPKDPAHARTLIRHLARVCAADGELDPGEMAIMSRIGGRMGLKDEVIGEALSAEMAKHQPASDEDLELELVSVEDKAAGPSLAVRVAEGRARDSDREFHRRRVARETRRRRRLEYGISVSLFFALLVVFGLRCATDPLARIEVNYRRLSEGMTRDQVVAIMGEPEREFREISNHPRLAVRTKKAPTERAWCCSWSTSFTTHSRRSTTRRTIVYTAYFHDDVVTKLTRVTHIE